MNYKIAALLRLWYNGKKEKGVAAMKVLVSACLLGRCCKYNGGHNYDPRVEASLEGKEVILVCPEVLAGFPVPRIPMEIVDGVLTDRAGNILQEAMDSAAAKLITQLPLEQIECAVLKSRSPSCGVKQVYDGSFSGRLVDGMGVFARALKEAGCRLVDAEDVPG